MPDKTTSAFNLTLVVSPAIPLTKNFKSRGLSPIWLMYWKRLFEGTVVYFYDFLVFMYFKFPILPACALANYVLAATGTASKSQNKSVN